MHECCHVHLRCTGRVGVTDSVSCPEMDCFCVHSVHVPAVPDSLNLKKQQQQTTQILPPPRPKIQTLSEESGVSILHFLEMLIVREPRVDQTILLSNLLDLHLSLSFFSLLPDLRTWRTTEVSVMMGTSPDHGQPCSLALFQFCIAKSKAPRGIYIYKKKKNKRRDSSRLADSATSSRKSVNTQASACKGLIRTKTKTWMQRAFKYTQENVHSLSGQEKHAS